MTNQQKGQVGYTFCQSNINQFVAGNGELNSKDHNSSLVPFLVLCMWLNFLKPQFFFLNKVF